MPATRSTACRRNVSRCSTALTRSAKGFTGVWLAYNAILKVTATDGGIKAEGWKWEQGDWKAGCDFDIKGKVAGGKFRLRGKGARNPDTLERDHGMPDRQPPR